MVGRPPLVCFKVEIDLSVPSKRVSTISTPKVAMPNHNGKPNFGGVKRDLELNPFNNLPKNIG